MHTPLVMMWKNDMCECVWKTNLWTFCCP